MIHRVQSLPRYITERMVTLEGAWSHPQKTTATFCKADSCYHCPVCNPAVIYLGRRYVARGHSRRDIFSFFSLSQEFPSMGQMSEQNSGNRVDKAENCQNNPSPWSGQMRRATVTACNERDPFRRTVFGNRNIRYSTPCYEICRRIMATYYSLFFFPPLSREILGYI